MNKEQSLLEFFTTQSVQIPVRVFLLNLFLSALLAYILGRVYVRFGTALSNREQFGRNFLLVTMTTMLIITIVKSSLALSLGLVGALSIIRFRAAIKEPEELSYLFLAISVGLGLGAEQTLVTVVAFLIILGILALRQIVRGRPPASNLHVTVTCPAPARPGAQKLLEILQGHAAQAALRRYDEGPDLVEAGFDASFESAARLDACTRQLATLGDGIRVSYLEDRGIGG